MNSILSVRNLTLRQGKKQLLRGLNLEFARGEVYALVGPNGAGKSTLAYALMGLEGYRDVSGEIWLDGKNVTQDSVAERGRKGMTLAWQEPARFQGLKVEDYLSAGAGETSHFSPAAALAAVGLEARTYLARAVDKTLSGGERKRIELAAILCMSPKVAFLDEPDSGVDVEALGHVSKAIDRLQSSGTTVVLITHRARILRQAQHAYLICSGKVRDEAHGGDVDQYFKRRCLTCSNQTKSLKKNHE